VSKQLVSIENYGEYSSNNYGAHSLMVDVGDLRLWFSYETVVALQGRTGSRRVCENIWGATTGKHLNWIDGGDKKSRLPADQFDKELAQMLEQHNLIVR